MRITQLTIKNYRSFGPTGQTIVFSSLKTALVGKNNSGKTNIFRALNLLTGSRHPSYIKFSKDDFFNLELPIEIDLRISDFNDEDLRILFASPIKQEAKKVLGKKFGSGEASIELKLIKFYKYSSIEESDTVADVESLQNENQDDTGKKDSFELITWGFHTYKKTEEIRKAILQLIVVPAVRKSEDELSASKWTYYGRLMKEVLEGSPQYEEIKELLANLNEKIQTVFTTEKNKLLEGARIASYVEDIQFQLTKENQPSELLRNLEIFITENSKLINIENVGTGTQSAIIIGILELALKNKHSILKVFCIEEPEAYIHPHGIRHLGSLVRGIPEENNTQVLLSTHSLSLVESFLPFEIIRVDKLSGETVVHQDTLLSTSHFRRFINAETAELFFSEKIIFVEGDTEKILFAELSKFTRLDAANPKSIVCDFDRANTSIIKLDGVKSIENYISIAEAFKIQYVAFVDLDFIASPDNQRACINLCKRLSIQYPQKAFVNITPEEIEQVRTELKSKNILINKTGETEDIFPLADIAAITGRSIDEIHALKANCGKTSKLFTKIFECGKVEYSMRIVDYYLLNGGAHPLESLIRHLYHL